MDRMIGRLTLLQLLLAVVCAANPLGEEALAEERIWTGKNGQQIRGKHGMVTPNRQWIDLTVMGKNRRIAIANLSDADQAFIHSCLDGKVTKPEPVSPPSGDPAAFKDAGQPDRSQLPLLNQGDHGQKQSDCVPSSICNFLLWWDQAGILPIPKRGEFADKAEWIHTVMARYCRTRNTAGTDVRAALDGIGEYFAKEVADLATVRSKIDHDLRPRNLARYTRGTNATMLEITTRREHGADGSHWVALMNAEEDGRVVLHTWGARFEGVLKVFEEDPTPVRVNGQTIPKTSYEIEFTNRDSLPQWVKDAEMRFLMFPERHDGIIVVKPFLYAIPGKRSAPPPDPLFEDETPAPEVPKVAPAPVAAAAPAPIKFINPVRTERPWAFHDGRILQGIVAMNEDGSLAIRDRQGQATSFRAEDLKPEDRAILEFWRGAQGEPVRVPRWDLTYQLATPKSGKLEIRVCTEGAMCRVELPGRKRVLVMDTGSGAFATTRPGTEITPAPAWAAVGKFAPERRFPQRRFEQSFGPGARDADRYQAFCNGLPGTLQTTGFGFPARGILSSLTTSQGEATVKNPRIDFTVMDAPAVTTGLLQCLCSQTAPESAGQGGNPFVFFHGMEFSYHRGFEILLPALQRQHLLPLRVAWTNDTQNSIIDQQRRQKTAGSFTIELQKAAVPGEFPAGFFDLPREARDAVPGTRVEIGG